MLSALASIPRRRTGPRLRLLYCHYVFDDQVSRFDAVLQTLRSMGAFVDTVTAIEIVKGNLPIARDVFHLSFDDGFKNIVSNAAPILRRHEIPAIFFVSTGFIAETTKSASAPLRSPWPSNIEMASWNDLEKAMSMGLEIGSHTRTHARFSELSGSVTAIEDELYGSKEDITRRLGACRYISWPYGRISDADDSVLTAVEKAGYDACFGAFRSPVIAGVTNRFRIPRHHIEVNWPDPHIRYFASGGLERRGQ